MDVGCATYDLRKIVSGLGFGDRIVFFLLVNQRAAVGDDPTHEATLRDPGFDVFELLVKDPNQC